MVISVRVLGVEGKPKMRRICLDDSDSTASLLWFPPTDNCGSFTHFSIYGRPDALSLYKFMGKYSNFASNSVQIKLPNLRKWEFYIVYSLACNGTDSLYSDTLLIDKTEPANSNIDSVSVDPVTQKIIIGWRKNPSLDTKGYFLYHVSNNTNAIIQNLVTTSATDNDPSRTGDKGPFTYSIAAYDSCNNLSLISLAHTTIFATGQYDYCLGKQIQLSWSPYKAWPSADYEFEIHLKINSGGFTKVATVQSGFSQFTYNFTNYGDNYCFLVRAKNKITGFTSSSNVVCIATNSITPAKNSYIAKVSVQNSQVEMTLVTQSGSSLQSINIYKEENNSGFTLWKKINTTGGVINLFDNQVKTDSRNYRYYFTTEGPCKIIFDSSQICKTILLDVSLISPGTQSINWNTYYEFIKLTQNQQLLLINSPNADKSSSWNILNSLPDNTTTAFDNSVFSSTFQQLCYCVRAIENDPDATYTRKDTSYSNIKCLTADPLVYFPNAIQLNGFNTQFYPQGIFIDSTKSSFQIFNRWGALLYETNDIQKGWEGKYSDGTLVEEDVYAYKAIIVGLNGKVLVFDGTVTVLK